MKAVIDNDKEAAAPEPRRKPAPVAALERRLRFLTKRQLIEQLRLRELQGEEACAASVEAGEAAALAQRRLEAKRDALAAQLSAALARASKAEGALRVEKMAYTNQTLKKHVLGDQLRQSERNAAMAQGQLDAERTAHAQQRQGRAHDQAYLYRTLELEARSENVRRTLNTLHFTQLSVYLRPWGAH